jgi:hypothetical protein
VSGKSDQSFEFEQTSIPIVISNSSTDMSFEFYSEIVPSIIKSGLLEVVSTFDLIQTSGILIYRNNFNVDFAFAMSTNGALLWERINANTPSEAWTQVNVSGGSWTPINASGTIETWIEKVV